MIIDKNIRKGVCKTNAEIFSLVYAKFESFAGDS